MVTTNEIFALRLRQLREQKKLKRVVLSELCGLHRNAVSQYERGEKVPTVHAVEQFADYFGVSVDYLLGRKEKNFEKYPKVNSQENHTSTLKP